MSDAAAEVRQLVARMQQHQVATYMAAFAARHDASEDNTFVFAAGRLADAGQEFLDGVAVGSLARAAAPVLTWTARLLEEGADSEATAVEVPGGVAFAVAAGRATGIALTTPDGARYVTLVRPDDDGGLQVAAGRWMPSPAPEAFALANALRGISGDASGLQMVRAAAALAGTAGEEDDLALAAMLPRFAKDGRLGMTAAIGSASLAWYGDEDPGHRGMATGSVALGASSRWAAYAGAMRELVVSEPPAPGHEEIRLVTSGGGGFVAEVALAADAGFYGETCAAAVDELALSAITLRLRQEAADYVALAEGLLDHGIAWGEQWLAYADTDRWTFAVAGPDGTLGRYHRNVDLIADVDSHVAVIRRDAEGQPTRLEIHIAHRPAETARDYNWQATAREVAIALANDAHLYADPEADPPRLTRGELAARIAAGEPLPPPAAGMDFVTGELLPGTIEDAHQVVANFFYGASEDSYALQALQGRQEKTVGWEVRTDFAEVEGEEAEMASPQP